MYHKFQKASSVLCTILYFMAFLFFLSGFIKVYQRESFLVYFLLGGCFLLISSGKKLWDKRT